MINTSHYQVTGEFILTRHMNDIEVQNEQMPCPNPAVRAFTSRYHINLFCEIVLFKVKDHCHFAMC
jgi:hypothetical protein